MEVKLRDYQVNGIEKIFTAWKDCRSVLFQMPTGTGKTTLFCEIVRRFIEEISPDKKVLIITHRKELVEQAFNRLVKDFHLTSGIIAANYLGIQDSQIQVASIQTLVRRVQHQNDVFSLVIIDESHHALASTYKTLWDFYPSSKFLGVTATPVRTNGEGFQDLFDILITSETIKWFIKNKHLSDIRYYATHTPDVSNIKIKAGDYDETELSEIMQDEAVMADLVQSYIDFAPEKKMIVFAVNRAHSTKIVEKFNSCGFEANSIDTYTSTDDRNRIVTDFRNNKFKILCNVNIFTEGFDCPDVDAVQLARPTKSLTLFIQQVGRCMRPHPNKEYGIVLDNAGLWKEHGLPKMERRWSLTGAEKPVCPTQNEILGLRDGSHRNTKELHETKGIRLIEIGELDNINLADTIDFNKIEKNLIDKTIITMRERIEDLISQIQEIEKLKEEANSNLAKEIFEEKLKTLQKELIDLQEKLQPKRFEQVLGLVIEKCQEIIENNEIFVEGDKDNFLIHFVEPYLKSISNLTTREQVAPKLSNIKVTKENTVNVIVKRKDTHSAKSAITDRAEQKNLKVTFPYGKVIEEYKAVDTYIKTVQEFGIEKVLKLKVTSGEPLIISNEIYKADLHKRYKHIPNSNYYILSNNNTHAKKEFLIRIGNLLNQQIIVEIVNK